MTSPNRIVSFWSDHDCSYCVLNDGIVELHEEYERFNREKEAAGDSLQFFLDQYGRKDDLSLIGGAVSCYPTRLIKRHEESWRRVGDILRRNGAIFNFIGHHQAHAANAFFSSDVEHALVVTVDGGGYEGDGGPLECGSALTAWVGHRNRLLPLEKVPLASINIGSVWSRATEYVFGLSAGWPRGHQAGSVMAMAAFGDPFVHQEAFRRALTTDLRLAIEKTKSGGAAAGSANLTQYWRDLRNIAERGESERFDLAAGLQAATESVFREWLGRFQRLVEVRKVCLAGGVALNSVMVGKIADWFPWLEEVFVPPTPHDGGLTIGAAQYMWHQILDKPRPEGGFRLSPYLGREYTLDDVRRAVAGFGSLIRSDACSDREAAGMLAEGKIMAIFAGRSESGRRALGNRSIFADPREPSMKARINEAVKHRQWFRPFAPVVLWEKAADWFHVRQELPYMSMTVTATDSARAAVSAVVHVDGSARVQTVKLSDNRWLHGFLGLWNSLSGVPILLNTSFNDREPICETPEHAIGCFLGTDIDCLYFPEHGLLISRRGAGLRRADTL